MFDSIGWGEIVVLALAALFIFGPERLPDLAKDARGALLRLRGAVSGARGQVQEALGDDFADLRDVDLRRYHPKALIRDHLLGADDGSGPTGLQAPAPSAADVDPTGVSARVRWAGPDRDARA